MSVLYSARRTFTRRSFSGLYGFCALLLLLLLSGCASITVVRLPPPERLQSDALKEVEAALTGKSFSGSTKIRTKRVLRLEARADKIEAKARVLEARATVLAGELAGYNKIIDGTKAKLEALQTRANDLQIEVQYDGDNATKKIEKLVVEAKRLVKESKAAVKKANKIGPKAFKAGFKAKKMRNKADKARKKAQEAQSAAERKVARKFAATLDKVEIADIVAESEGADLILLGEVHSNDMHHQFQLDVITALVESGRKIAIGMEMFMVDSQETLNGWIDGETNLEDFRVLYYTNWKTPWAKYAPILLFAKEKELDIVALSLERDAVKEMFKKTAPEPEPEAEPAPESGDAVAATDSTGKDKAAAKQSAATEPGGEGTDAGVLVAPEPGAQKVAVSREGIGPDGEITPEAEAEIDAEVEAEIEAALAVVDDEEEEEPSILMSREEMEAIACDVEPQYKQMIIDAIGEHAEDMNFDLTRFCRIQVVWDTAMAKSAKAYIEENPETTLVVIAGGMHVWKRAIPKQLTRLGSESIAELAGARVIAREAKAVAGEAKAAVKKAKEALSSAELIASRARRTAREAASAVGTGGSSYGRGDGSFMGLRADRDAGTGGTAEREAAADAGASAEIAKHNVERAAERVEELEAKYKEARKAARSATKALRALEKSKSEFKAVVVIPEMPEYEYFRSGGASTDDADYLLLH